MNTKLTPISLLSISAVIGLVATVVFILIATQRPWFGFTFAPEEHSGIRVINAQGPSAAVPIGTVIAKLESENGTIELMPVDLTIEPDGKLHTYEIYYDFLKRQGIIANIINSDIVRFISDENKVFVVQPQNSRPFTSLPAGFWVALVVGLFAWLISSAVFAFRRTEESAGYLLLSGAATLTFSPFSAIYATRELAMPETLFMWLSDGNFFGGSIFIASFIALLLCYPKPIGPKWLRPGMVILFTVWFILQQIDVFESMTFARRLLVMIGMAMTFVLAGIHWFRTRQDPVARAALQWFLISWMLGTCAFCLFILLPQIFGVDTSALQNYAFSLFLLVYGGLAFGILRYKLFALGQWWGNIVLWALTVLMLVVFDLLFLLALQFSSELSISLALLFSGILWLPLRSFVWNRFLRKNELSKEEEFRQIVDIALTPKGEDIEARWRNLIQSIYNPLNLNESKGVSKCFMDTEGQKLLIPQVGPISGLSLEYAHGGHRLFTTSDLKLAEEFVELLKHIIGSRSDYEKGVLEERQRIAQDMHDNIGAQLLGALHNQNSDQKDTMIRDTLSDLRNIINNASRPDQTIDEMLADLRVETIERLQASDINHNWMIKSDVKSTVEQPVIHTLKSIIRETISNVIKHSDADTATVKIHQSEECIKLTVSDNGKGYDLSSGYTGNGLANIKTRAANVNGEAIYEGGESGFIVAVKIPYAEKDQT